MKAKLRKFFCILIFLCCLIVAGRFILLKIYPLKYSEYINTYSNQYALDPLFVAAVIKAESNFQPDAKSNKDARGLMQITDDTGKWIAEQMNIKDFQSSQLHDAETNIKMGCWYLDNLAQEFNGNKELILAAYNGGRGNVKNWLQNSNNTSDGVTLKYIPFKETDKYIKRVKVNYNIYKYLYKGGSKS